MKIYINAYKHESGQFSISLESYIIINIHKISNNNNIKIYIKLLDKIGEDYFINIDLNNCKIINEVPKIINNCIWPVIVINNCYVVAGLSSISRQIVRESNNPTINKLLGFRNACLMACSENSIWTKFCEVDIITTTKNILRQPSTYFNINKKILTIPEDVVRFEYHMNQPIRIHNVYKFARETNKNKSINSSVPIDELNLGHIYSEGPFMTLADVILFICVEIFFKIFHSNLLNDKLPLIYSWFMNIKQMNLIADFNLNLNENWEIIHVVEPKIMKQSLYTADPNRYKPEKRIYTKQKDITNSLKIIYDNHIDINNDENPYGVEINFDWTKIPLDANPIGGALPEKRATKKCDQLMNLAKAVIKIAGIERHKIVDFCSGSGHLGILLACLLPNCEIILVDNKEQSLIRAKERILKLQLSNIIILQTNLDYFVGQFDIGVALHACGVATDLVIQNCIKNRAHFVCCPCCYGGIHDCYHLKYPRSVQFQNLSMEYKDYLILAHAADQTHDSNNKKTTQGFICMDAVDTDRKLYAESCGYNVYLGKLQPVCCTNKNNLLVGIYNK